MGVKHKVSIFKRTKNPMPGQKKKFSVLRTLELTVAAVAVFGLGVAVGQGRITFGRDAIFKKPVSNNLPQDLDYASVEQIYDSLRQNFDGQLDAGKLQDGLKQGLAKSTGDPYTEFFNAEGAKDFQEQLNGTFTGIGAELSKNPENNTIIVVAPIAGFPAEKAGIRPKDVIAEIDGKSAYDLTITDAVNKIRGEKGTKVKLKIIRDSKEELEFEITREEIKIPSVTTKTLDGNIGYIKIARFSDDTAKLTSEAATKFKSDGVKGVVLDMRGDPGGLLDAAVSVSSLWLEDKTILTERRDGSVIRTFDSKGTATLKGMPTVVLINAGSASASEITAGALKDHKAATLIGEKSFGKGSVQSIVNFRDDSILKVTIARWYTPAGKNIDKEGITPDKEIKLTDDDYKNNKDPQLDAALTELKK